MAKLILVDDDQDILDLGRTLLAHAGHDVLTAVGALEAIELLRAYGADAIITDANMPVHNGYDLIRTVRKDPKHGTTPIAMLTGRRERRDIERALELGVNDYILKPLDPILFMKKVETLIAMRAEEDRIPEIDLAKARSQAEGRVSHAIELRSISEMGLAIIGPHKLSERQIVQVDTPLFTQMGIQPPIMKVLTCVQLEGGKYESRILFVGADEQVLTKIRAWIFSHPTRGVRKAS